jgi:hypothetical protein
MTDTCRSLTGSSFTTWQQAATACSRSICSNPALHLQSSSQRVCLHLGTCRCPQTACVDTFPPVAARSVPLLTPLTREQKMQLVDAFSEEVIEGECSV